MNDRSLRPFLAGFFLVTLGVFFYWYWQQQQRKLQAPGVVTVGSATPEPPPASPASIAASVTQEVANSLAKMADSVQSRPATTPAGSSADDLTVIKGIGPTYAARLNAAGIMTYADLAATPAERLVEIAKLQPWQAASPAAWIADAAARSA